MYLPRAIPRRPALLLLAVPLALVACGDAATSPDITSHAPGSRASTTLTGSAPVIASIGDVTAPEGSAAALSVSATDVDGGALSYSWDLNNDGTFELATGEANNTTFSVPDNGTFTYQVRVQDLEGNQAAATGQVIGTNVAPTVNPVSAVQGEAGALLSIQVSAADPGGQNDMQHPATWRLCVGTCALFEGGILVLARGELPGTVMTVRLNGVGTHPGWVELQDKDGGVSRVPIELTIVPSTNQPPVANAGGPYTGVAGIPITLSAAGSTDPNGDDLWEIWWDTNNDGESGPGSDEPIGTTASVTFPAAGVYTIGVAVMDSRLTWGYATATVTVSNAKPTMTFSAPAVVAEGTAIALSASGVSDAAAAITYSCNGGATFGTTASCPAVDGPATVAVVGRVTNEGGYTDYPQTVSVTNAAPAIASLTLPPAPVAVGTDVSLSAAYSDDWANDGHSATIDWGDASISAAAVGTPNAGEISATHTYTTPGVYTVTLTVIDDANASAVKSHQYVVVYDPSAGFVTGAGWIAYGATACPVLCGGAAGRGDFGFVSKYKKGATVPTGDTRFEFHAGTLAFASAEYEWLLVAGKRAQFKGRGTINGTGDYGFLLTAVDDATDAFRIKIWNRATSSIVFDNQMGADDNAPVNTLLNRVSGSGSIVIHAK